MRGLGITMALIVGFGMTLQTVRAEDCACHGVPKDHEVLAGAAMRVDAASATVSTTSGDTTVSLSAGGTADLGEYSEGQVTKVVVTLTVTDPDDDVCEAGTSDAYAVINGSLTLDAGSTSGAMTGSSTGAFTGTWTPSGAGTTTLSISGTVSDSAVDHGSSDDPDLTLKKEYKAKIKIKKK